jgi:hypothetical protein
VALAIAAVITVGACSSANRASTDPTTSAPVSAPSATTTTVRPHPAAITPTPDFSFDDSVPPPKLVNTGKNYVAILKSLEAYGNWAAAHHPDPALVATNTARGTKVFDAFVGDLTRLRKTRQRLIETLGEPSKYQILSTTHDAFSARVVEDILVHKTVATTGRVTSEYDYTGPTTYLMLAVLVGNRWYLASIERQRTPNVQL